jgi:protein tyrosine/serine phosphatase
MTEAVASESVAARTSHLSQGPGRWWRRYGRFALLSTVAGAAVLGALVGHILGQHNFHVVSPGLIYRSAQLDAAGLTQVVQQHGIKSILNLRGADGSAWYKAETNRSQQLGVRHYDFALEAGRELKNEEMDQILAMIDSAPKPMLIHCKSGADRTGLVGALYLYSLEGKSSALAGRELTVLCGHVPYLFWRDTIAMDRSFERYVSLHAQPIAGAGKAGGSFPGRDLQAGKNF